MQELRPSLWSQAEIVTQLRHSLYLSNNENRELKALVVSLSEMILRQVTNKK
jgi:hypothetical protein